MPCFRLALLIGAASVGVAACSDPTSSGSGQQAQATAGPPARTTSQGAPQPLQIADPQPLAVPPPPAAADGPPPAGSTIQDAAWTPASGAPADRDSLVRAEVLLDRAHFSPGVIDGKDGDNLHQAIAAFEAARGLPVDGRLTPQVWSALTRDAAPALIEYQITPADVAGPFLARIPTRYDEMSRLPKLGYTSPLEGLAEKFHMDEALLKALNPKADFAHAGERIQVAQTGAEALPAPVARIEVDKSARQVRAFGANGALLASYPATVGSTERPAPSGTFEVKGVAKNPVYTYDPKRLTFGDPTTGKLKIRPGPNNPVGVVWIDLTIPTYGIHGAPDPRLVGKTASHGCVRLTNWDAWQLASAVKKGVKVTFVGEDGPSPRLNSASAVSPAAPG